VKNTFLSLALAAGLVSFAGNAHAQDLYVGSNSSGNTTNFRVGFHAYSATYVGYDEGASNNTLNVFNTNTRLENIGELVVGVSGSSNSMTISNGGYVVSYGTYIGSNNLSSNNSVLVTGSSSLWYNQDDLVVGVSGSSNSMTISNGGAVTNDYDSYIGSNNLSSNNSVLVTGSNSVWSIASVYVGFSGSSNSMTISNGGMVDVGLVYIGGASLSSNNSVLVTGSNSLCTNIVLLSVGASGSSNSMVISNGGMIADDVGYIGGASLSSNNSVLVTGTNSLWTNSAKLYVGYAGSSNSMTISNGGTVVSAIGYIGSNNLSSNNSVTVTGNNSLWMNSSNLIIGNLSSGNRLTISNGGSVADSFGYLGNDDSSSNVSSSNNSILVTGAGSLWSNSRAVYIGHDGSNNSMIISDGGTVVNLTGVIGYNPNAQNSSVLVTGDNSLWRNGKTNYIGYQGSGTLTVANGGTVQALGGIIIASDVGSAGTLNIGSLGGNDTAGTISTPTITFGLGTGTINFNQADTANITNPISGSGSINQLGAGTTKLSASNSFVGSTVVSAGTLIITSGGTLSGGGNTTVGINGCLTNNGAIAGLTTISGSLGGNGGSFSTLKFNSLSSLNWDLNSFTGTAGTNWDVLNASSLDFTTAFNGMTLNIIGTSGIGNGSSAYIFNLINVSESIIDFNPNDIIVDSSRFKMDPTLAGGTWSVQTAVVVGVNQLRAVYTIPEPSTYALFGLGALALVRAYRNRSRKVA